MKVFRQTFNPIFYFLGRQNGKWSLVALVKIAQLLRSEVFPNLTACGFHRLARIVNDGWPPTIALPTLRPHDLAVLTDFDDNDEKVQKIELIE